MEIQAMHKFFGCGPKVEEIYELAPGVILVVTSEGSYRCYFHSSLAKFKDISFSKSWGVNNLSEKKVFAFIFETHNSSWKEILDKVEARIVSRDGKPLKYFLKPKKIA